MVSQVLIDKVAESQFSGIPDNVVADALNAPDPLLPLVKKDVSTADVKEILLSTGEWAAIDLTAQNTSLPESLRGACIVVRDTIKETSTIRTSVPDIFTSVSTVLGALLTATIISQSTYNAMIELTERRPSWSENNGLYPVTSRDVGLARGAVA